MKKFFKLAAVATLAMLTVVACKNNKTTEEPVDSTAIEAVAEEEMIDTLIAVEDTTPVVEEQAAPATKKVTKKAEEPKLEATTVDPTAKKVAPDPTAKAVKAEGEATVDPTVKRTRR